MGFGMPKAELLSAKANLRNAQVKPRSGGRREKTPSKVGINELLRGI